MFVGFATASLLFLPHTATVIAVLALCGASAVLFTLDDLANLPAFVKLVGQIGLALIAVGVFGFAINALYLPVLRVPVHLGLLALPITVLWIVGMKNTVNLLDGVDGLAAGVVTIVAAVLIIAEVSRPGPNQREVVVLAAALGGSCLGFLIFNFNPARIFMGDSGAEFLGMALALLSVLGVAKLAVGAALLVPVVALAVPIVDAAWSIIRRRRARKSFAIGDRSHFHHRLLEFGLNQRQTCVIFYGATAGFGSVALTIFGHRRILLVVATLLVLIVVLLLSRRFRVGKWRVPVPGGEIIRLILHRGSPVSDRS
jgi:UDP-GlcNAc:undecaprenyl-phosphate GlcNAc-1-phosphate transferase